MTGEPTTSGDNTVTIVGIDEAGYGPLLGPLVVSATAFDVPAELLATCKDPACGPNLWKALRRSLCKKPGKKNPRLAVADSKLLHGRVDTEHGVSLLERVVLTFLAQADRHPANLVSLLRILCPHVVEQLTQHPWYCRADLPLPLECSSGDVLVQRNALAGDLARNGIRFRGAWVEVLCEGYFNQLVGATHNKSVVLFQQNMRLIQRIAERVGQRPLWIWADRHGGRTAYLKPLMTAWADAEFEVLEESPDRSGYRLTRSGNPWTIRFVVEGETCQMPVALASIFSKYVRELFMICFNRYWCGRIPALRPTAGYNQDGRRFLADIDALVKEQNVDRNWLVRLL